jgi:CHAD domain-containing protein
MSEASETIAVPWALSPEDRVQPAARVFALVLERHLEDFRRREAAVRAGEDAEDLHKYRVVVRRTRSLLVAGEGVFPVEELALLSALVAQLAALTSPVRDLDVLLHDLDERVDSVAPRLRGGLPDLRDQLLEDRKRWRAQLTDALDGDFSDVLLRRWQIMASVYRVGGTEPGPDALRPAGEAVDEVVWATFGRLRKLGRRARRSEEDTDWHRLRKRLKRFRYLLLAFEDMYPEGTFSKVLRELADLQDGLGELQDHVARADLIESAGLRAGGHGALLAGALVDHLSAETPEARRACERSWDAFDRPKVRRHLRSALASAEDR